MAKNDKPSHYGKKSSIVAKIAIICIVVAMAGFGIYVGIQFYNMPEYATEREINALAKDYYENYFYGKLLENSNEIGTTIPDIMKKYIEEDGIPPVKLRQFFLYADGRHKDSEKIFTTKEYPCNTNVSTVKYTPVAPYGRTDYTYEVNLSCKKT